MPTDYDPNIRRRLQAMVDLAWGKLRGGNSKRLSYSERTSLRTLIEVHAAYENVGGANTRVATEAVKIALDCQANNTARTVISRLRDLDLIGDFERRSGGKYVTIPADTIKAIKEIDEIERKIHTVVRLEEYCNENVPTREELEIDLKRAEVFIDRDDDLHQKIRDTIEGRLQKSATD